MIDHYCDPSFRFTEKSPYDYHIMLIRKMKDYRRDVILQNELPDNVVNAIETIDSAQMFGKLPKLIQSSIDEVLKIISSRIIDPRSSLRGKTALRYFDHLYRFIDDTVRIKLGFCEKVDYRKYSIDLLSEEYLDTKDFGFYEEHVFLYAYHTPILARLMDDSNLKGIEFLDIFVELAEEYRDTPGDNVCEDFNIDYELGIKFLNRYKDRFHHIRTKILHQYNDEDLVYSHYHSLDETRIHLIPVIKCKKILLELLLWERGSPLIRSRLRKRLHELGMIQ